MWRSKLRKFVKKITTTNNNFITGTAIMTLLQPGSGQFVYYILSHHIYPNKWTPKYWVWLRYYIFPHELLLKVIMLMSSVPDSILFSSVITVNEFASTWLDWHILLYSNFLAGSFNYSRSSKWLWLVWLGDMLPWNYVLDIQVTPEFSLYFSRYCTFLALPSTSQPPLS